MVVHWGGKLMASLDYKDTNDHLPVLVLGVNGTKLLWFACRRHVGEVMLSNCWDSLNIEASSGSNIQLFKR